MLEVVQGEKFLAQADCVLGPEAPAGRALDFVIPETDRLFGAEPVQIRMWSDGHGAGMVTAVAVARA